MENKEQIELLYHTLLAKYRKLVLDKKELSIELGISVSCINYRIIKGLGLPSYKKGSGKCGRIGFPIISVSRFIVENNIKVADFVW